MKLRWSAFALADRDEIFDHVEADNPRAALALDDQLQRQIERLIRFPELGRMGRIAGTRESVINRTPYVAAYGIDQGAVLILRILHGARDWPDDVSDPS